MNPAQVLPNDDLAPCALCGGDESHDPRCPEMHRCPECFALVEGGEEHDAQCTRYTDARVTRRSQVVEDFISDAQLLAQAAREFGQ